MTRYVALLRAVNVGGTGKLPMVELRALCEEAGFGEVRTYIASGNIVFHSEASAASVKQALEARLLAHAGSPIGVQLRTADEMAAVLDANPFPDGAPKRTVAIFLDDAPPTDLLDTVRCHRDEQIEPGRREIYVLYGDGMADSRLVIPCARAGTARNLNTVAKLASMAASKP